MVQNHHELILHHHTKHVSIRHAQLIADTLKSILDAIFQHPQHELRQSTILGSLNSTLIFDSNNLLLPSARQTIPKIFQQQRLLRGDSPAIASSQVNLTYDELDELTSRLASYLNSQDSAGSTKRIAICFEKSPWVIVALLAVLKAGSAFVLLDGASPRERLETIVQACEARVVLCSEREYELCLSIVETDSSVNVIVVDSTSVDSLCHITPFDTRNISYEVGPQDEAYVIFTSGTTGTPKGIVVEHGAFCAGAAAHGKAMLIDETSRVLQFASYTFDACLVEILTTLIHGGCVCVPAPEERGPGIEDVMEAMEVNWAVLVPSFAKILEPKRLPSLRTLVLAGEALDREDLLMWTPQVQLVNGYGPSECCVAAVVNSNMVLGSDPMEIGRAIGCRTWVVDATDHHRLLPLGCIGELLIEGPILARGYLNDEEKTEASFIRNPRWTELEGAPVTGRLYKTGDLVRYDENGTLFFVGRKDTQVKVNGQRIELGEIEYHIRRLLPPRWRAAVQAIQHRSGGHTRQLLVAFFQPGDATDEVSLGHLAADTIKMTLRMQMIVEELQLTLPVYLPTFMIPSIFTPLSNIPTLPSGKIDRKELGRMAKKLSVQHLLAQTNHVHLRDRSQRPETSMEIRMCQLWAEVLGLEEDMIGLEDSLFRLGGDSLTAMRLVAMVQRDGFALVVADIFKYPTLRQQAAMVGFANGKNAPLLYIEPYTLMDTDTTLNHDPVAKQVAAMCRVNEDAVLDVFPCTPLQEGLIALSIQKNGSYVSRLTYRLPESIDIGRFQAAWEVVIAKHPILRTRIVQIEQLGMLQAVLSEARTSWQDADALEAYLDRDFALRMELGDPLARYAIIKTRETRLFVWTIHHAVHDGWTVPLLLRDVSLVYENSIPVTLSTPFTYFISYLKRIDADACRNFWISQLDGAQSVSFPETSHLLQDINADAITSRTVCLPQNVGSNITMSSHLRAAWALVISQYSGSKDVVFGAVSAGRHAPLSGITTMTGPTIATVPIRMSIDDNKIIAEFLHDVQQQATEMIQYEQVGLQNIRRFGSDLDKTCSFRNLLIVQPANPMDTYDNKLFNDQLEDRDTATMFTYPLTMQCEMANDNVKLIAQFDERFIDPQQMDRIVRLFEHVLLQIMENAGSLKVGDIDFIPLDELAELQIAAGEPVQAISACLHSLVEQRAHSQPHATAICSWDGAFSYEELSSLSTRFAHHLTAVGVKPGVIVPVCFEKSAWAVVAMLAVLKSGAAFMALDPAHPIQRLEYMAHNANAFLIIASPSFAGLFNDSSFKLHILSPEIINSLPVENGIAGEPVKSSDPAAIIFTSGSTGNPKGIVLPHSSLCSSSAAHVKPYGLTKDSRVLQFAAYTFDESIEDIFTTLIVGGCICIPSDFDRLNNLTEAINKLQANWAIITPTVANLLEPADVQSLKTLGLGGEPVTKALIAKWSGYARIMNIYGPAECSMAAICNAELQASDAGCIGRPVGGRAWIVNSENHNQLSVIGSVGELLIEGPLLAQGYLNDEAKTSAAFVTSPTWARDLSKAGVPRRFYKTGDLVRFGSDFALHFVGRKDTQVKLHGQRIELSEIEHQISVTNKCAEVMICMPTAGFCQQRICAVWVPSEAKMRHGSAMDAGIELWTKSTETSISTLREDLHAVLPTYMIPSLWVAVSGIPLLPSGKLNRRIVSMWLEGIASETFQKLNQCGDESEYAIEKPASEMEKRLREVWAHVLNFEAAKMPLQKSFLRLGGDSISAIQVVTRCRTEGLLVTVHDILKCQSIADLARHVSVIDKGVIPTEDDEKTGVLFDLSPIQLMHKSLVSEATNHFNQSFLLRLEKSMVAHEINCAIEMLVKRHSMLRARFCKDTDGRWKQYVTEDINESFDLNMHAIKQQTEIIPIIEESQRHLDIEKGPLLRADFVEVEDDTQMIFLVAHHLVIDLVSWRILLQDLEELLQTGNLSSEKSISFSSWCRMQDNYARKHLKAKDASLPFEISDVDLEYWGVGTEKNTYGDTESQSFILDQQTTLQLLTDANNALGTQPLEVMLGVLIHTFTECFDDRSPPMIYNEGHGRQPWDPAIDLSRTVGWFTTVSPITTASTKYVIDTVKLMKDAQRSVRDQGWAWFTSRFLSTESQNDAGIKLPLEIMFNYFGQYQQLERNDSVLRQIPMEGLELMDVGAKIPRPALFEISAFVETGHMKVTFYYNRWAKQQHKTQKWISSFQETLKRACGELCEMEPQPTLSDFPHLSLSYDRLEDFGQAIATQTGLHVGTDIEGAYPCSSMQEGLILSRMKDVGLYRIIHTWEVVARRVGEQVDPGRLRDAWLEVVRRHPSLRTLFLEFQPTDPLKSPLIQVVCKENADTSPLVLVDCAASATAVDKQQQHQSSGIMPPYSVSICRSEDGKLLFKLEISHLIVDGASMSILLRDLVLAYEGKLSSAQKPLLYQDYVAFLEDIDHLVAINYWGTYLADLSPSFFPALNDNVVEGEVQSLKVDLTRDSELRPFCDRNGITLATLFQTAWGLVLRCFTSETDVCFGYLASGRDVPLNGIDDAVGLFINLLVCRCKLESKLPLKEVLDAVQADFINSVPHQHCSLAKIQHSLNLPTKEPLFNTIMSFQRKPVENEGGNALNFEMIMGKDPTEVRYNPKEENFLLLTRA